MTTKQGIIVIFSSNTDNELNCSDFYVNSNNSSGDSDANIGSSFLLKIPKLLCPCLLAEHTTMLHYVLVGITEDSGVIRQ